MLTSVLFTSLEEPNPSTIIGKEVAGLVVGALPLAITALQCYEYCSGLNRIVRMRKSYVRNFARSLQGYDASLQLDLKIILKSIEPECEWTAAEIQNALEDDEILGRMRYYLGEHSDTFQQTIEEVNEILEKALRSIEGLIDVPADASNRVVLKTVSKTNKETIKVKLYKGFKLALNKSEIETYTKDLKVATDLIYKFNFLPLPSTT